MNFLQSAIYILINTLVRSDLGDGLERIRIIGYRENGKTFKIVDAKVKEYLDE